MCRRMYNVLNENTMVRIHAFVSSDENERPLFSCGDRFVHGNADISRASSGALEYGSVMELKMMGSRAA